MSYILAIDQSTSASKAFLLDDKGNITKRFSKKHRQYYPAPGYVEHDAKEIWHNVLEGIRCLTQDGEEVAGIAIANQRETVVLWDRDSGKPLSHAIVWQDVRGENICKDLAQYKDDIRSATGLPLSAYFSAAKAAAKLREDLHLQRLADKGKLCIGTMDSYLIFCMTGGKTFSTDVSNASRTQLMDIKTLAWSESLCGLFGISSQCLPLIQPSDAVFGYCTALETLANTPILGVMGDSHAAFFGHGCYQAGMTKATYGTGSSVMMHVGNSPLFSSKGLYTSVGYSFRQETCYVLEGNVISSGDTLQWLSKEAGLASDMADVERCVLAHEDSQGVYLVPAFSGLGSPHNQPAARGIICGLSRGSTREHIVRAALESIAFQNADVINAMLGDTHTTLPELCVDGGASGNDVLMQFQADLLGCAVQSAYSSELSAKGAGMMAGMTLGIYGGIEGLSLEKGKRYEPRESSSWREKKLRGWHDAVKRCSQ